MKRFWQYLEDEPEELVDIIKCLLFWFAVKLAYIYLFVYFLVGRYIAGFKMSGSDMILVYFFSVQIEELIFRVIPFFLSFIIFKRAPDIFYKTAVALMLFFISTIIFGILHGGLVNILVQGVGGFILGIVYLRCGGYSGKVLKPFAVASILHFIYNIHLGFVILS